MTIDPASPPNRWRKLAIQGLLAAAVLALLAWCVRPDGRIHVVFLETKGDAALIQTPAGGYVLIDGGSDPATLTAALGRRLPFWRRTLDAVVLTIPDAAHLPGEVAALARYRAGVALAPPIARRDGALDEWLRLLGESHTPVRAVQVGDQLDVGGATLHVLAAGDGDESGLVLRLDYGATSVVFDHSGGEADEEALVASGGLAPATLVAFPWQRDPHTPIIEALHPRALIFTDGHEADHPVEQTVAERAIGGARLFHERLDGAIEWISDGKKSFILTER